MALYRQLHLLALPLGMGLALGACSTFYPPGDGDDPITRCGNSDDCPNTGDNRRDALCVRGEGQSNDSDGVCIEEYKQVGCNPTDDVAATADFFMKYDGAIESAYVCSEENQGKVGCPPSPETGCDEGLTAEDVEGTLACVDLNAPVRQIPARIGDEGNWRQDIQHAFCRAYFCDDRFVCSNPTSPNEAICVLCDGSDPDQGGCVEIYVNGGLSPVYASETANCGGDLDPNAVVLGPTPG